VKVSAAIGLKATVVATHEAEVSPVQLVGAYAEVDEFVIQAKPADAPFVSLLAVLRASKKLVGAVTDTSTTLAPNAEIIAHPQLTTVMLALVGVVPVPIVETAVTSSGVVVSTPLNTSAIPVSPSVAIALPAIVRVTSPVEAKILLNVPTLA